jgi:hypothetical protein
MYYTNIKYHCPKCGEGQDIYQAWGNVTTFHYVDTIDEWGNADMTEIAEAEFRKSDRDGFYCATCFAFITYDLNDEIKNKPELFIWETRD